MSRSDRYHTHSEERLSSALHDLASASPQAASETTRATLLREFQSQHRRRTTIRVGVLLAVAVTVFGSWLGINSRHRDNGRVERIASVSNSTLPSKVDPPAQDRHELPQSPTAKVHKKSSHSSKSEKEPSFVALPAFALVMPDEDLRTVRVEMPLSSLRLLGARVSDEYITRTVVADLLVGPDGTPYAFRLIT